MRHSLATPNYVKLEKEFDAPSLAAQLNVLLLLARSFREILTNEEASVVLEERHSSWLDCVSVMGELAAEEVPQYQTTSEIKELWDIFLHKARIRSLSEAAQDLLVTASDRCVAAANGNSDFISDLWIANATAYADVRAVLAAHKLAALMPHAPVPVELHFDLAGRDYCAATHRFTGKIRWSYQQLPHVLAGLIIADYLFAHEYLSHLVPRNSYLDNSVREHWLMEALKRTIIHNSSQPTWKRQLWALYRDGLVLHVLGETKKTRTSAPGSVAFGTSVIADNALVLFVQNQTLFWKITSEILSQRSSERAARMTTSVLEHLGVMALDPHKSYSIKQLHAMH